MNNLNDLIKTLNLENLNYKNLPKNSVVCLIAPTASGKTDLAFKLYETGRFELISVDSALIYRGMNVGTAKPTPAELSRFPHHLVDIIAPTDTYNVATFVADVEILINQIHQNNKIPLLVGGTMMYYMALLDGLSAVPDTQPATRQKVMAWLNDEGIGDLYAYLQTHDPDICERLKISDTQRITRAVEVYLQTGTPMSVWQATPKIAPCRDLSQLWLTLSVEPDRAWLHERIEKRLDVMWENGLVEEVVALLEQYPTLTPDMPSMRCVGYRQVLEFLAIKGHEVMQISPAWQSFSKNLQKEPSNTIQMACQDMKNKALYATRQLAKRQSTWQRSLARLNDVHRSSFIASFSSIQEVEKQLL